MPHAATLRRPTRAKGVHQSVHPSKATVARWANDASNRNEAGNVARFAPPMTSRKNAVMTMQRREFLVGAGAILGAATTAQAASPNTAAAKLPADLSTWEAVRDQFLLTREQIHMAMMLFASHPRPVRDAIDDHRHGFDLNPVTYLHEHMERCETETRAAVAGYVGAAPEEVAITGNTTTGLSMLYGSIPLAARKIVASDTPYAPSYARLSPSLLNTPEEVSKVVGEIAAL